MRLLAYRWLYDYYFNAALVYEHRDNRGDTVNSWLWWLYESEAEMAYKETKRIKP